MSQPTPLLLRRGDVAALLDLDAAAAAVEGAFLAHGRGLAPPPALASVGAETGAFHVKAGIMRLGRSYFAAKTNANFPGNRVRYGLPTIQGTIVLHDAENGSPLAVMDSIEITIQRTAAATAVAARALAREDAATLAIIGCGRQGQAHARALARIRRFDRLVLCDVDRMAAEAVAAQLEPELDIAITIEGDAARAAVRAAVCVTCTPSRRFILDRRALRPGMFVAGVGADDENKRELAPDLLAAATVVVDVLEQAAAIGDLHHAIDAGLLSEQDVRAELGEIIAGKVTGRRRADEVIVFDSTGMALQDAAVAAVVYERALERGAGMTLDFAG